ncbi:MAG: hypothetical protein A2Y33_14645 [Spirochaetes bacterium GWF1_51_8]|nr:MAG: hypothetical protein A2Y33_14645 [Spirochaetes bacterium GWF1_51_8]
MKKAIFTVVVLTVILWNGADASELSPETQKRLKMLDAQYPSISAQVMESAANSILGTDYDNAVNKLAGYLKDTGADIRMGMEMILQSAFYQAKSSPSAEGIVIDGDGSEWIGAGWDKFDEKGDNPGKNSTLDIVRAGAVVHDGVLYGVIETVKPPSYPNRFVVYLDSDADGYYDYQFIAGWDKSGAKTAWMNDFIKKVYNLSFESDAECGNVYEYAIRLSDYGIDIEGLAEKFNIGVQTADKDFKYVESLDLIPVARSMENLPLTLLLALMDKGVAPAGDSIPIALALANADLYSVCDKEVRKMILADMVKHYALYRKIVTWQESWGCPYLLSSIPVIPKIFWAERHRYSYYYMADAMNIFKVKAITKEIYTEFADRIDVLEAIHALVVKNGLGKTDISVAGGALEDWVHNHRLYLSSMENLEQFSKWGWYAEEMLAKAKKLKGEGKYFQEYFGRLHRWDDFGWINYQYTHLIKEGCFIGDCGDTTVAQMAFYKMAGIAPVSFQMIDLSGNAVYTHNFPGHFDPNLNRWCFYQVPNPIGPGGKDMNNSKVVLHFNKPFPHPWLYNGYYQNVKEGSLDVSASYNYPGEITVLRTMINFLKTGMSASKMEFLYSTNITLTKEVLFDKIPDKLTDSDGDGLYDIVEKELGVNSASWDSDGDLYSDLWELHNGQSPEKPNASGTIALDGFLGDWKDLKGVTEVKDLKGDSKVKENVFDISAFYIYPQNDLVYLGAEFYGDPAKNRIQNIEFWIDAPGRIPSGIWFGGGYEKVWGSYDSFFGNISVQYAPGMWSNLTSMLSERIVFSDGIEAVLPLAYLHYPVWLSVKFLMSSGPKGKEVQGADEADRIYIQLAEDSDNDSLSDGLEKEIGTDGNKWDTDGDLLSDNWEYWHGHDPLSAKSPSMKEKTALDGFAGDIAALPGSVTLDDPKGDTLLENAGFDIASVTAAVSGGMLYVGVKFHGDNTGKYCTHYGLTITADEKREYWIGSGWDSMAGPDLSQALWITKSDGKGGQWPAIPKMDGAMFYAKRDAEFVIPVAYLGNPIKYSIKAAVTVKVKENDFKWMDDAGELKL